MVARGEREAKLSALPLDLRITRAGLKGRQNTTCLSPFQGCPFFKKMTQGRVLRTLPLATFRPRLRRSKGAQNTAKSKLIGIVYIVDRNRLYRCTPLLRGHLLSRKGDDSTAEAASVIYALPSVRWSCLGAY
jgi:hypothetical protein